MQRIRKRKIQPGLWIVTIASNEKNLLDIFSSVYYLQPMFSKMNPDIVGIAENEESAKELTVQILQDIYEKEGNFDVRSYFQFQE